MIDSWLIISKSYRENNVIIEVFFADMYVDKVAQIPAYDFWNFLGTVEISFYLSPVNEKDAANS